MRLTLATLVLFLASFCVTPVLGQGEAQTPVESPGIGSLVWTFLNSPVGISVVGLLFAFIVGKVFTKKPAWKVYADKYKPLLIQAIKQAEKAIPDTTENAGAKKLDLALKYVLKINDQLDNNVLALAITALHAEAEAAGNV